MHSDPIADLLTRLRNANDSQKTEVTVPFSKMKESIVKILVEKQYVESYTTEGEGYEKVMHVHLFPHRKLNLKRISKPGQRIYKSAKDIKAVHNGYGIAIYSTTSGVVSNQEARKKQCGGELLCEIY